MDYLLKLIDVSFDIFPVIAILYLVFILWQIEKSNSFSEMTKKFQSHFKSKMLLPFALIVALSLLLKSGTLIFTIMDANHPRTFADNLELFSDIALTLFMVYAIYFANKLVMNKEVKK